MKKKLTALFLCIVIVLSLCACGKKQTGIKGDWVFYAGMSGSETVYAETFEQNGKELPTFTSDGETYTLVISGSAFTGTVSDLEEDEDESEGEKSYDYGYYLTGDGTTGDFVILMKNDEPDMMYLIISSGEDSALLFVFERQTENG